MTFNIKYKGMPHNSIAKDALVAKRIKFTDFFFYSREEKVLKGNRLTNKYG